MFSDVNEDNVHAADINCIAYYGVTLGMGDGTYAPDANVSAFEMRLFVERAADRMGADGDAVLGGVMLSDPVTRLEMAQLMFGLVDDIDDDVRINPRDGQIEFFDYDTNDWVKVDDYFADVKNQQPIAESQLVGATFELGITFGRSGNVSTAGSVFAPLDPVTRAQMASFIARTLDHSNLRPEGLAFQHNNAGDSMISLRDGDFEPIADARIDVFSALYGDDAFDPDDGECELRFVRDETPSHATCVIDIGDQLTDDQGNIEFTPVSLGGDPIRTTCNAFGGDDPYVFSTVQGSEGRSYWTWSGELGDEVDADTTFADLENVARPVGTAMPDYARVSGGLPTDDEIAKMGETVTFTVQLYSDAGANGRDTNDLIDDVVAGPDRNRNPYHLRVEKYFLSRVDGSDSDTEPASGTASTAQGTLTPRFTMAPGDWNYASNLGIPAGTAFNVERDTVVWPNADGELLITLTNPDLRAGMNDVDVGVTFTLTPFTVGNDVIDRNLISAVEVESTAYDATEIKGTPDRATGAVIFSDDAPDPHKVEATVQGQSAWYRIIAGSRTGNSVTVTVLDQYGDPMRNTHVFLSSDLDGAAEDLTTAALEDQVVYPEEVDRTLHPRENYDGDDTPGEDTAVSDPKVRLIELISSDAVPDGSGTTVRTTRTAALPVNNAGDALRATQQDETPGTFRTRSNGAYRIGYNYINSGTAQTEAITPQSARIMEVAISKASDGTLSENTTAFSRNTDGTIPPTAGTRTLTAAEVGDAVTVYWASVGSNSFSQAAATDTTPQMVDVLVADVATRTIVVNRGAPESGGSPQSDNPEAYFYDEDDTFIVDNQGATFEMFEEALGLTSKADGVYPDQISWENYTLVRDTGPNRPARVGRTIWEVSLTCGDSGPSHPRTN